MKIIIYLYYALLLIIMISWTDLETPPPTNFRLAYLFAVVLLGFVGRNAILPAVLTCFWSIAINGYSYSYMPTMQYIYAGVVFLGYFLLMRSKETYIKIKGQKYSFYFFVIITLINLFSSFTIESISYSLFIICLFPFFISSNDKYSINYLSMAFMIISVVLSFYSLTTQEMFKGIYGTFDGIERSVWADPNYLGMVIGMGALIGFERILRFNNNKLFFKLLCIMAFALSFPAMLLIASRGALLCLISGMLVLVLFSSSSKLYKFFTLLSCLLFINYLYTNSYFELIENRMQNDINFDSGRSDIWEDKIQMFVSKANLFNWIVGFGYNKGLTIEGGGAQGFHNDYIAFGVEYGIIGIVAFIKWLFIPINNLIRNVSRERIKALSFWVYIIVSCFTLEPFSGGNFAAFAFFFYIILISENKKYAQ